MEEVKANSGAGGAGKARISFDDFAKLDLRVGVVLECREHANADKLLVMKVDLGTEQRQICAGLKGHYKPEELVGKRVVVVANLEPRVLRGEPSQGMILAASDGPLKQRVMVVTPEGEMSAGSVVS